MARIAIDARLCAYRQGGIASYTRHLAAALAPELAARGHTLILGHARRGRPVLPNTPPVQQPRLWTPPHHRLEQYTLPIEFLRAHPALLHSPDFVPLAGPWRTAITVHDLDFVRHPDRLTPDAQRYYGQVAAAVHRADEIIAVSYATRDDLVSLLGVNADAVTVIHEAADPLFRPPEDGNATSLTHSGKAFPSRYFLMVGTIEPRKNHDTLLDAYAAYRRATADPAALVVAGTEGWNAFPTVARLRGEPGVIWLGAVTPEELLPLYHGALALLMPSWEEGFGLPVIEAIASGTPVVISTARALVEIAGDAALTATPDDARAWVAVMNRLDESPLRAALRERGYRQAARYSWTRVARETADVYERLLARPRRMMGRRRKRAN
ncbi:MAG TPA: glycosyltransferase family 1 protein [Thermomicrobiales bacterium]|jgi:glycosyltransferase involved in cell wall biosynthesis